MDKYEIPFLVKDIQEQMPLISDSLVKIPHSYEMGLPKNLMEQSTKIDNKFLNNYLSAIEELNHFFPNHSIPSWIKNYQNIYFKSNLIHDGFFKANLEEFHNIGRSPNKVFHKSGHMIGNPKVLGALIETTTSDNVTGSGNQAFLFAFPYSNFVVNSWYDQMNSKRGTVSGNNNLGIYDDVAGVPTNLKATTGSVPANTSYTAGMLSFTEFQALSTTYWGVETVASGTTDLKLNNAFTTTRRHASYTYTATLADPCVSTTASGDNLGRQAVGHS